MNQILVTYKNNFFIEDIVLKKYFRKKKRYLYIFFVSIIVCIILSSYFMFLYFSELNQRKKTNLVKNNYDVSLLYSNSNSYDAIKLSNDISIIGLIEIPSINISYPILSNINKDLLKISVCRFLGPLPNRIGNLCIAGHNYKNNMMFSNLYKLKVNNSIFITDLNNIRLEYIIYDKFKIRENDLNCTKNTNHIEITLITCNQNNNSERIIIKAKIKDE